MWQWRESVVICTVMAMAGGALLTGCQNPKERAAAREAEVERQLRLDSQLSSIQSQIGTLSGQVETMRPSVMHPSLQTDKPLIVKVQVEPVTGRVHSQGTSAQAQTSAKKAGTRPTSGSARNVIRVKASVRDVQRALTNAGCNPGAADGVLGAKTKAAIKAFQQQQGLKADGIVGNATWAQLQPFLR